jgi:putative hydrolase of HD superfamily
MITGELLELVYEAASIQRWNDHMRPAQGFTELDKQAQKMVYAYILAKFEETEGTINFDWTKLIEGGLFEFLHRIKLTDIKPPVFHRMMEQKGNEINEWVLNEYEALFDGIDSKMHMRFKDYLFDSDYARNE